MSYTLFLFISLFFNFISMSSSCGGNHDSGWGKDKDEDELN